MKSWTAAKAWHPDVVCALILGNDRQFSLVHEEGPLAGRGEANFDLAQRAVAAHLRDLSGAVAVVADEHAFSVARRGAARRRLGDGRSFASAAKDNTCVGPSMFGRGAAAAPFADGPGAAGAAG